MDQGAVDSPVTLVIKAPNQKYDDQTISCFLNWTVEKLKKHISNVYPSKPSSKDQRLVYSGRLLQDHLQLRDVLRKQDEYHMLHLVCATHSPPESPSTHSSASTPGTADASSGNFDGSSSSSSSPASSPNQDGPSTSTTGSSDGLRHRGPSHTVNPAPPGIMQDPAGFPVPMQAGAPLPAHPMYMPMQMLWWQQMYARHYYMQYQAALAASQAPITASAPSPSATLSPPQPPQANDPPAAAAAAPNPAVAVAAVPEDRPANPNIQMNAQGGPVLNDDELNRDWLDWMYTVSRAAILLSIVYFYSSFGRFVMVIGAMLLVYLHQAGWFPFRQEQNPGAGEAPQEEVDRHNDMQEMERLMDEGVDEEDGESGEEGQPDGANPGPPYPGFLAAAWSFISTFFTSLIPEGPAHGAN
ncbi:homocysteine-responsive endoplasmic reticulum-resident ubiquitin-like domain member 2 protein [Alosa sapidissima]|uniref:homocysteine-responsive endoplasmic reticulum-resident ubiquitin-like domain member 2 protein n=1 Tax=Alosa sapidissima TaxID=34773 RepID=UPI001C099612|nr:homocysteine-responsive endoplasmic reticulum-resident ubiquitin-like domain member 2 protein [Alosa sapidissima]XP_041963240.1 homocysteine-responsive endoplasmic reticulum-resident ubiquitin-like domain member 2 protein [Alosa sapidissima]